MICLFGGTFDPIHLGHMHAALTVCEALSLDQVHMVLSAQPAHRDPTGATSQQRWQMLELACESQPQLVADDREMRRSGPSYTVDTLTDARAECGADPLCWVIGSDALADLPSWKRWRDVLSLCNLVVLSRPGSQEVYPEAVRELLAQRATDAVPNEPTGQVFVVEARMRSISASQVRHALAVGGAVEHLLPARVAAYISEHGLYGA